MKMKDYPSWQYDEFKQIGKDYSLPTEVAVYDASHGDFRDIEQESLAVLQTLAVKATDVLIDFGAGTGTFALQAARYCAKVYAVDVSLTMLDYAKAKAARAGVSNIVFCHGGFLTYDPGDQSVDAIATTFAFHHLPDFWKGVALDRMNAMLKPNGQLYIKDVIIEAGKVEAGNPLGNIAAFIEQQAAAGGDFLREDAEGHFREEYSTYDWILEGLLGRSGFTIQQKWMQGGVIGHYHCRKERAVVSPYRGNNT
jgi:putative AdoMet-dependent methyltransferase